ncbi:MAG: TOBE domain-containing protein, partial [Clostridia bacterium]|nr:TOBE domain-containing protein [Clostridia bacterium]
AMRTEITKLHQRLQTTFIYVTHDQTEAMTMASRIVVMKDGVVQQVDTPQNLYDFPANEFVAGFIGSPQMNFFDVRLRREGNDVVAVFGENKIVVPRGKIEKFYDESYIGREVVMGMRPENIHDDEMFLNANPDATIAVDVEVTEKMGSETYLYLTTTGKEGNIIARVNARTTTNTGDKIKVAFDVNHLHFFDKETSRTILESEAVPAPRK